MDLFFGHSFVSSLVYYSRIKACEQLKAVTHLLVPSREDIPPCSVTGPCPSCYSILVLLAQTCFHEIVRHFVCRLSTTSFFPREACLAWWTRTSTNLQLTTLEATSSSCPAAPIPPGQLSVWPWEFRYFDFSCFYFTSLFENQQNT